jgi:hypothetical protein
MAETLGSLCDKLTIVKLKTWHSEQQPKRIRSLATQEQQLREEIDASIADAASDRIPVERLTFAANKVYRKEGNAVAEVTGSIGAGFSHLAEVIAGCGTRWTKLRKSKKCRLTPETTNAVNFSSARNDFPVLHARRIVPLLLSRRQ